MRIPFGPLRHAVAKPTVAAVVVVTLLAVAWHGRGALVKAAGKGATLVRQTVTAASTRSP
jgi:hypothetical protein